MLSVIFVIFIIFLVVIVPDFDICYLFLLSFCFLDWSCALSNVWAEMPRLSLSRSRLTVFGKSGILILCPQSARKGHPCQNYRLCHRFQIDTSVHFRLAWGHFDLKCHNSNCGSCKRWWHNQVGQNQLGMCTTPRAHLLNAHDVTMCTTQRARTPGRLLGCVVTFSWCEQTFFSQSFVLLWRQSLSNITSSPKFSRNSNQLGSVKFDIYKTAESKRLYDFCHNDNRSVNMQCPFKRFASIEVCLLISTTLI